MNNGGVRIGFSEPYVAIYSHNGNDISYANGQKMARGVSANLTSSSNGSNKFYADNVEAESAAGKFTGGTLALTVDGLALEADKLMRGLPVATSLTVGSDTVQVYADNDDADTPYVGVGYIENGSLRTCRATAPWSFINASSPPRTRERRQRRKPPTGRPRISRLTWCAATRPNAIGGCAASTRRPRPRRLRSSNRCSI